MPLEVRESIPLYMDSLGFASAMILVNRLGLQEYIRPVEGLASFSPHGPDGDSHADSFGKF
jgi:hypothetical protein